MTTVPFNVNQSWVPGDYISVDYNQEEKSSLARITLDFNLLDFRTMAGVARMQTVNSINVYKAMADKELGFTIFGPSFGLKGTVKKVAGTACGHPAAGSNQRPADCRQIPLSALLEADSEMKPDPVVLEKIRQDFRNLSQTDKIGEMQTCLYLKGYNVPVTGRLDNKTQAALASFKPGYKSAQGASDTELYVELWSSLGDNMEQVANRREMLARALEGSSPVEGVAAAPAKKTQTQG